ncbi:hypothetical protein JHW43_002885 [Diplocarpon mali]|nr:hypothetical protein JHW43_002885 [Diplocarpon mali]
MLHLESCIETIGPPATPMPNLPPRARQGFSSPRGVRHPGNGIAKVGAASRDSLHGAEPLPTTVNNSPSPGVGIGRIAHDYSNSKQAPAARCPLPIASCQLLAPTQAPPARSADRSRTPRSERARPLPRLPNSTNSMIHPEPHRQAAAKIVGLVFESLGAEPPPSPPRALREIVADLSTDLHSSISPGGRSRAVGIRMPSSSSWAGQAAAEVPDAPIHARIHDQVRRRVGHPGRGVLCGAGDWAGRHGLAGELGSGSTHVQRAAASAPHNTASARHSIRPCFRTVHADCARSTGVGGGSSAPRVPQGASRGRAAVVAGVRRNVTVTAPRDALPICGASSSASPITRSDSPHTPGSSRPLAPFLKDLEGCPSPSTTISESRSCAGCPAPVLLVVLSLPESVQCPPHASTGDQRKQPRANQTPDPAAPPPRT